MLGRLAIHKADSILLSSVGKDLLGFLEGRGLLEALLDQGEWRHGSLLATLGPPLLGPNRTAPGHSRSTLTNSLPTALSQF